MLVLDNLNTWPAHIIEQLYSDSVIRLLENNDSIEPIREEPILLDIFEDVQQYALSKGVVCYHCTKQLPEYPYKITGLKTLNFETHHSNFLKYICNYPGVDKKCFDRIKKALLKFRNDPCDSREKKLWFVFTRDPVLDLGTECFFKYYGGEAIYMPFIYEPEMQDITKILESIGEPVVVEIRLFPSDIVTCKQDGFGRPAFGRILVECFAKSINPNFCRDGGEGYIEKDVPPEDIAVHSYDIFRKLLNEYFRTFYLC